MSHPAMDKASGSKLISDVMQIEKGYYHGTTIMMIKLFSGVGGERLQYLHSFGHLYNKDHFSLQPNKKALVLFIYSKSIIPFCHLSITIVQTIKHVSLSYVSSGKRKTSSHQQSEGSSEGDVDYTTIYNTSPQMV